MHTPLPPRSGQNQGDRIGPFGFVPWARSRMKILLSSYAFYPSVGGLEAVSAMLAEQFSLRGHEVVIVTQTAGEWKTAGYEVVRRPAKRRLCQLVRWCDVYLQNNMNLRAAWPLLFISRPWAIINNGAIPDNFTGLAKRFCARFAAASGVSEDAARNIGARIVIPNCYEDGVFRELPEVTRDGALMFLGRLVSEKGVDVLLRALHQLKGEGLAPALTVVGGGPEEASLRELTASLDLGAQVRFAGVMRGEELVRELNRHKIMVAPSTYREPFGIVALEAIACGCVVVGSEQGGLREAIGPCGVTFPNGDASGLAARLKALLLDEEKMRACRSRAAEHLARFTRKNVADTYLRVLERLRRPSAAHLRREPRTDAASLSGDGARERTTRRD
jgi:glycogen synthase